MRFSRYVSNYFDISDNLEPNKWISRINELIVDYKIDVVMPVSERALRKLIIFKKQINFKEKVLLPNSIGSFETAKDKWILSEHLKAHNIPGPKSLKVDLSQDNFSYNIPLNFPLLIKPSVEGVSGRGIIKCETLKEFKKHLPQLNTKSEYILQEFVQGVDMGFNVLCQNGEILAYTIQLGTLFRKNPFKPQIGLRMVVEEEVYQEVEKLMKTLEWNGVAHIDLVYDRMTKNFSIVEINPRYWLTLPASCMSGVNFPLLYCMAVQGVSFRVPEYKLMDYLEPKGLIKTIRKNPFYLLRFSKIWKQTPIKYLIKDPFMTVYQSLLFLRNRFQRT